jgi:sec-independent protein translocase protein TatA
MLSIPDMAILGAAALLLFGPEQLPRVMRKTGQVMREIQNTSQAFVREMERAADTYEPADASTATSAHETTPPSDMTAWEPTGEHDVAPGTADPAAGTAEPAVAEKLAEPRPAPGASSPTLVTAPDASAPEPHSVPETPTQRVSRPAELPPQGDHPTHV